MSRQNNYSKYPTFGKYKKEKDQTQYYKIYVEKKQPKETIREESNLKNHYKYNQKLYWREYHPKINQKLQDQETNSMQVLNNKETCNFENIDKDICKSNDLNIFSKHEDKTPLNKFKEDIRASNYEMTIKNANFLENKEFEENLCGKTENDREKKPISRKSSNTVDNIVNNILDDQEINENSWNYENDEKLIESRLDAHSNLIGDEDDLELVNLIFHNDEKLSLSSKFFGKNEPFATTKNQANKNKNAMFLDTKNFPNQNWNSGNSHNQKTLNYLKNTQMNQINFPIKQIKCETMKENIDLEKHFKDLFPIDFEHNKFPIFSLFTQRVPNHDFNEEVWFYKDPQNEIQGPFNSCDMDNWNSDGYFSLSLEIAWNQKENFILIEQFIKNPSTLILLSLKYINIQRYFKYGSIIQPTFNCNIGEKKIKEENKNIFSQEINRQINTVSTESLKLMLGIQNNK